MLMDAMDHIAYNPEDCLPLFGTSLEVVDLSLLENGDNDSVDEYPFSPIIETLFGPASLTADESLSKSGAIYPQAFDAPNEQSQRSTDECCGFANLDEVPMDLDTSDEETFSASYNKTVTPKRKDYSTELDEIELRSRALRSLLLKKGSPPKSLESRESPAAPNPLPVSDQFSKLLSIGSGKHARMKSQEKFIITICETSSDSDKEPDSKAVEPSTKPDSKVTNVPHHHHQVLSSINEPSASEAKDHRVAERQLLQQKMILLRQRLTVKRQQRIVDERRQIVRKLTGTLSELRKRVKHVSSLCKQASKSLLQAQRLHTSQQKKLLIAQRSYSSMCEKLSQTDTHWSQLDLVRLASEPINLPDQSITRNHAAQRKDLVLGSLEALQRARSTTAYFTFYRFDCGLAVPNHTDKTATLGDQISNLRDSSPCDSSTDLLNKSTNLIHPTIPLCPFLLDGECKDATCMLQHPPALLNVKPALKSDNKQSALRTYSSNASTRFVIEARVPSSADENAFCEVCKEPLVSSREIHAPTALRKWHSAYLAFKRSSGKCASLLKTFLLESQSLMKEFPDCAALADHHLTIVCLQNNADVSDRILECLTLCQFPLTACKCVLRNCCLSVPLRITIARSTIKYISSQLQRIPSQPISPLSISLVYVVYQCSRLLLESESTGSVINFLKELQSNLPKPHPCHFGVWWIKLSLDLTQALPDESSLFSSINLPMFPKTVVLENLSLIQEACSDLGVPDQTMNMAPDILESSELSLLSNCFLALHYLHVHSLLVTQQYEDAARLCWRFSLIPAMQANDDLFYPLAVYASFHANSTISWTTVQSQIPELVHSVANVPYRIEYGFLVANLAWRKNMLTVARDALLESLASLILISSDVDSDVLIAFQRLLHPDENQCISDEVTTQLGSRGHTYLWLSYCLYCVICSTNVHEALGQLITHCKMRTGRATSDHLFDRLLLHMALSLLNRLHASTGTLYCEMVTGVLCNPVMKFDRQSLPTWFIELVQRIQLASLSSPGERHDLCVSLVETYGAALIPSFSRGLLALGDRFLARSLCSIGRLDNPDSEAFWLLFASLLFSDPAKSRLSEESHCLPMLIELFTDATAAVPSSASLWSQYTRAVLSSGLSPDSLRKRAEEVGMSATVLGVLDFYSRKTDPINSNSARPIQSVPASAALKKPQKTSLVSNSTKPINAIRRPVNAFKLLRKCK